MIGSHLHRLKVGAVTAFWYYRNECARWGDHGMMELTARGSGSARS